MRGIVLSAALLFLAGCDREPEAPPPPPPAPRPEFPPLPDLTPPPIADGDFMELPAEGAASFGWDLREGTHHNYEYKQESHGVLAITGAGQSGKSTLRTQWKGAAEVIGGGGRGELAFVASPVAQWSNDKPLESEELNRIPKMVVRYLAREDGKLASPQIMSGQEDPKLEVYFAMPSRSLKPGESEVRELHLAKLESEAKFHGTQEINHAGRRKVDRYECVKLVSKIDCDASSPGDSQGRLTGTVAAYFAPRERTFVRIDAVLLLAIDVRREVKPADPHAPTFWVMNRVQGDMKITLKLKD